MEKRTFRRIMMILLACAFLFCAGIVVSVNYKYIVNKRLNRTAVREFTTQRTETAESGSAAPADPGPGDKTGSGKAERICAPITVDFEKLKAYNPEIIGWIYCEDTVINYPIAQANDNDFYIDHSYDRRSNPCGALFAECLNRRDFADSNTIVYGHHLIDGSMFASLEKWAKQDYFDEHPVMWILTPERDYRVELFAAYYISATSDAYTVFQGPSPELDEYLALTKQRSAVTADVELDGEAKYVMLSTCAYVFSLARSVIHGKMVPVDSAGGTLLA